MTDVPSHLIAFQQRFPDEEACAKYLFELKWPDGFCCPRCGHGQAWALRCKAHTFECTRCHHQTSVTAGTILHATKLDLTVWFWGAWLMASHSNGISAVQLMAELGLGSYRTAWMLLAKLRRAMVDPDRNPLKDIVEVDETSIPYRTKDDPIGGGQGRSHRAKMAIIGAVEVGGDKVGRIRLAPLKDYSARSLHNFLGRHVATGTKVETDGWAAYAGQPGIEHSPHVIGPMAAHAVLPWIHRIFSNLKRWGLGVYHGLRRKHLATYLDEFVFRFNRRHNRPSGFRSLFRIAMHKTHIGYEMLTAPDVRA